MAGSRPIVGWRRRQLEYRFQQQIGLAPKTMARLCRFRHAVSMLTSGCQPTRAAGICGFSDQAHLTREFQTFIGISPARFRARVRADSDAVTLAEHSVRHIRSLALAP